MKESHGYDVNSGAGLIIICPKTRRIVLGLRSGSEEYSGGTWCTFGGMMQNKETPLEAALREAIKISQSSIEQVIFY